MATTNSLKNELKNQEKEQEESEKKKVNAKSLGLKALLGTPTMHKKFEEVLNKNANSFITSVVNLVNNDSYLADSNPMSIAAGALVAATLNLGLDKNLGYAYLVPFNAKNKQTGKWEKKANFILGYKGYIQLAQRSGQYKSLNVIEIYDGELESWNRLTEELIFNPDGKKSDEVIGYVGYFELLNGFKKTVYWSKEEIETHRIRFNKDKDKNKLSGVWATDYDAMAKKTVLRGLLSKWGILSTEMQEAVSSDETVKEVEPDGSLIDITDEVTDEKQLNQTDNEQASEKDVQEKSITDDSGQPALFDEKNPPLVTTKE